MTLRCFDAWTIRALANGTFPTPALEAAAAHLQCCGTCRDAVVDAAQSGPTLAGTVMFTRPGVGSYSNERRRLKVAAVVCSVAAMTAAWLYEGVAPPPMSRPIGERTEQSPALQTLAPPSAAPGPNDPVSQGPRIRPVDSASLSTPVPQLAAKAGALGQSIDRSILPASPDKPRTREVERVETVEPARVQTSDGRFVRTTLD